MPSVRDRTSVAALSVSTMSPLLLRQHVAFGHSLHPRIIVCLGPRSTGGVIQQLAMTGGQVFALAGEKHAQDSVAFFTHSKAHCIGMAVGRQSGARLRITQIAAGL